ncbi:MAG: hypothetical protein ACM3SY_09605 [Candidatus Omnitrophota bacterium]
MAEKKPNVVSKSGKISPEGDVPTLKNARPDYRAPIHSGIIVEIAPEIMPEIAPQVPTHPEIAVFIPPHPEVAYEVRYEVRHPGPHPEVATEVGPPYWRPKPIVEMAPSPSGWGRPGGIVVEIAPETVPYHPVVEIAPIRIGITPVQVEVAPYGPPGIVVEVAPEVRQPK